jgi:hypothetical protein
VSTNGANLDDYTGGCREKCRQNRWGKCIISVGGPPDAKPATSATTWEHCGTKSAKALHRKAVRAIGRVGIGKSKRKSRMSISSVGLALLSLVNAQKPLS